jgi:hypothetical protein
VAGNDRAIGVNNDRIGEAEFPHRSDDLVDLSFWMGARVARVRFETTGGPVSDRERARAG